MLYGSKNTKENRVAIRQGEFNRLLANGYKQETYKEVEFFTLDEGKYFALKVYHGTAANFTEYVNYRTAERRAEVIQNYKNNYDSRQTYKAELKEKNKGKSSSHAGAAAAIKAELKTAFPGIKFSVTSDSFSMGNSVDIRWEDGPTDNEVSDIACKYQYGHFNGMDDIYENTNSRTDIPQAKYVHTSRSKSDTIKNLLPQLETLLNGYPSDDWHNKPDQILYRIFCRTSLPAIYSDITINKTNCTGGSIEDFYQFTFNSPEQQKQAEQPNFKPVETTAGEINIIDYSEKAFAVIGTAADLKALQPKMYELGGKWNKYLSCGPGYIFSKKKLDEVTKALSEDQQEPEPQPSKNIEEAKAGIKDEVKKMIEFFAETDIKNNGFVSEGTKQAAAVQNVPLIYVEKPEQYNSLEDIAAAAEGGKVISLYNLSKLVNHV